ncbi:hypothetical protein [Oleiharenicola lentus]|uniref:hypothetical protein n=1 Tax=Oleiharenicola lentus TaxID=2508720 RepID=UPI003F67418B
MKSTPSAQLQEAAHLEKLRTQIASDIEILHRKEASMREHEQRLRDMIESAQPAMRSTVSTTPFMMSMASDHAQLDAGWEKYNRAHALLEAARRGIADDRLALRDRETRAQQREDELDRRETWVKIQEAELTTKKTTPPPAPTPTKRKRSFTAAPFLIAKNLLMPGRS